MPAISRTDEVGVLNADVTSEEGDRFTSYAQPKESIPSTKAVHTMTAQWAAQALPW